MRVAKLSSDVFANDAAVDAFFTAEFARRNPPGLFLVGRQVAADGLAPEETVLFTYRGRLRYIARVVSGRQDNTFARQASYPYCFFLDPSSVRHADATLAEVEQALAAAGTAVSLAGRGWTRVPDSGC